MHVYRMPEFREATPFIPANWADEDWLDQQESLERQARGRESVEGRRRREMNEREALQSQRILVGMPEGSEVFSYVA